MNFSDNFDGSKAEEWTPYGIWYNQDGVLTANGGPTDGEAWTYYYLNNRRYKDFTMEFDVLSQKANQFGVVLRTSTQTAEPDLKDGYAIMNDKAWAFFGKFNGRWNTINTETGNGVPGSDVLTEYEIAGNVPKHWKIVAKDGVISVYFDGAQTPSMQVQDNAYTSGLIGFRCLTQPNEEASVKIANFSITGDGSTTTEAGYIKTGDQADYTLWIALAAVALIGGAAVFTVRKKGCKDR